MALINCPECDGEISDSARNCPHCGYKIIKIANTKAKKLLIILSVFLAVAIVGLIMFILFKPCKHQWLNATCEKPKECRLCGEIDSEALGHQWLEATCSNPKTCKVCNKMDGNKLDHTWEDATCTEAKRCVICNEVLGQAKGHVWKEATYTEPKTCTVCGATEGNTLVKPNPSVVGIYQMSYLDGLDSVTESLNFYSNGSVEHICNTTDENGYGNWSLNGDTVNFTLFWDGSDHVLYEKATLVDGGIMWGSSFLRKIS